MSCPRGWVAVGDRIELRTSAQCCVCGLGVLCGQAGREEALSILPRPAQCHTIGLDLLGLEPVLICLFSFCLDRCAFDFCWPLGRLVLRPNTPITVVLSVALVSLGACSVLRSHSWHHKP